MLRPWYEGAQQEWSPLNTESIERRVDIMHKKGRVLVMVPQVLYNIYRKTVRPESGHVMASWCGRTRVPKPRRQAQVWLPARTGHEARKEMIKFVSGRGKPLKRQVVTGLCENQVHGVPHRRRHGKRGRYGGRLNGVGGNRRSNQNTALEGVPLGRRHTARRRKQKAPFHFHFQYC